MRLEERSEQIGIILTTLLGIVFAVFCGLLIGRGQITTLGTLFGFIVAIGLVLIFRVHIWLLIPLCLPMSGQVAFLPLPFSVMELAVLLVFPVFFVFKAL